MANTSSLSLNAGQGTKGQRSFGSESYPFRQDQLLLANLLEVKEGGVRLAWLVA